MSIYLLYVSDQVWSNRNAQKRFAASRLMLCGSSKILRYIARNRRWVVFMTGWYGLHARIFGMPTQQTKETALMVSTSEEDSSPYPSLTGMEIFQTGVISCALYIYKVWMSNHSGFKSSKPPMAHACMNVLAELCWFKVCVILRPETSHTSLEEWWPRNAGQYQRSKFNFQPLKSYDAKPWSILIS